MPHIHHICISVWYWPTLLMCDCTNVELFILLLIIVGLADLCIYIV